MASFAVRPSRPWSVEESAMFAARKEFELLKLLSTDKKALATARRLGAFRPQPQPPSFTRSRCWCWKGCGCAAPRCRCSIGVCNGTKFSPEAQCRAQRAAPCSSASSVAQSLNAGSPVHCAPAPPRRRHAWSSWRARRRGRFLRLCETRAG